MLLTQPGCASRASTSRPLDRQIYILESRKTGELHGSEDVVCGLTFATADYEVLVCATER
jgi:hypothetical protein